MIFDKGDVLLIPFPFSDLSQTKKRPVLALSQADLQGDFIALAMTTRNQHANLVTVGLDDYASTPLPKPTWIRSDKIFTFNDSLIIKRISKLEEPAISRALELLCKKLGK